MHSEGDRAHTGSRTALLCFLGDVRTDRRVKNFIHVLAADGWHVTLLYAIPGVDSSAGCEIEGVTVRQLPLQRRQGPWMFWEYDRALRAALGSIRADLALACDLYSLSALADTKRAQRVLRLFYDSREVYAELPNVARRLLVKATWTFLERRALAVTDVVLVTGEQDANEIFRLHSALPRTLLVRNMPLLPGPISPDEAFLRGLCIPFGKQVVLYVGGLQEGRGLRQLVEAIRMLDDAVLLLIGRGSIEKELKLMAADIPNKVIFAGAIDSERVLSIAAACDVGIALVEPISRSYELALPSKLFEYKMSGLPVVTSELDQIKKQFGVTDSVEYVSVKDITSLAKSIGYALLRSKNQEFRESIKEVARAKFHFECDAAAFSSLAEQLLKDSH